MSSLGAFLKWSLGKQRVKDSETLFLLINISKEENLSISKLILKLAIFGYIVAKTAFTSLTNNPGNLLS